MFVPESANRAVVFLTLVAPNIELLIFQHALAACTSHLTYWLVRLNEEQIPLAVTAVWTSGLHFS